MHLRKSIIHKSLIGIGILLLVLTYEIHIRQHYFEIVGLAGIAALVIAAVVFHTTTQSQTLQKIKCCILIAIIFTYPILGYTILGISDSPSELSKPAAQMIICLALIFITTDTNKFFIAIAIISAILATVSILIYAFDRFLLWEMYYNRSMSIFFDPNYAAALFGLGAVSSLALPNGKLRLTTMTLSLTGAAIAFSKATIIALTITFLFSLYLKNKKQRTSILITSAAIISTLFIYTNDVLRFFSTNIMALRVDTGLNLRDIYWRLGVEEILISPLTLRSSTDVVNLISPFGVNTSLHNTYIETAFLYGSLFCGALIFISLFSITRYLRHKNYTLAILLVYIVISANNFTFMLGSPNIMSFAMGILIINGIIGKPRSFPYHTSNSTSIPTPTPDT